MKGDAEMGRILSALPIKWGNGLALMIVWLQLNALMIQSTEMRPPAQRRRRRRRRRCRRLFPRLKSFPFFVMFS